MVSLVESGESGTSVKDDRSLEYPEEEDVVEGKGDLKGFKRLALQFFLGIKRYQFSQFFTLA